MTIIITKHFYFHHCIFIFIIYQNNCVCSNLTSSVMRIEIIFMLYIYICYMSIALVNMLETTRALFCGRFNKDSKSMSSKSRQNDHVFVHLYPMNILASRIANASHHNIVILPFDAIYN